MAATILLVEDEANIREAVAFVLSRAGWAVHGHGNGASAVDEVLRVRPDMVVLDVMLPGRSGLDILRDLRARAETEHLPILMLTAKGQAKDRDLAHALGANAFLTKPFSNTDLVEALHGLARSVSIAVPGDAADGRA